MLSARIFVKPWIASPVVIPEEDDDSILTLENIILLGLTFFAYLWIIICAYYMPPRGADDLTYHLPPIYEWVVKHRIYLLPLSLRDYLTFPFNADLLSLWPAIFFHSQQYVDFVQISIAIVGAVTMYALSRLLNQTRKISLFIALLFLLMPVVLMQAGTNFIDLTTSVFFLISIYLGMQFYQKGDLFYLYAAAVAMGNMLGMKFTMVLLVFSLQFLILPKLLLKHKKHFIYYALIIFILGGYWYLRNAFLFGDPFYVGASKEMIFGTLPKLPGSSAIDFVQIFEDFLYKCILLFSHDPGLGSVNGGFGLAFWGIALPAWLYIFIESCKKIRKGGYAQFFLWFQLITGLIIILAAPRSVLQWIVRYGLFVGAIGLLAVGSVLTLFKKHPIYLAFLKGACILFSMCSILLLAWTGWPTYRIDSITNRILKKDNSSEFRLLKHSPWYIQDQYRFWEVTDFITRDTPQGATCYIASGWDSFWVTHFYGSKLQNKIWNFEENPQGSPDICFFNFKETSATKKIIYVGSKAFTLEQIAKNEDYLLIASLSQRFLFINKNFLEKYNRRALLLNFYQDHLKELIPIIKTIISETDPNIPIFISSSVGNALRYLELRNQIKNKIYWAPDNIVEELVRNSPEKIFYSFNQTFPGYQSEIIAREEFEETEIILYRNHLP